MGREREEKKEEEEEVERVGELEGRTGEGADLASGGDVWP